MPPALQSLLDRFGGARRVLIVGVGVATAALVFGVSRWATAPAWVPAFSAVPLEQVGAVTEKLDQASIPYRLEQNGTQIVVAAPNLARARVTVAADGGMPNAGRPGLELFDQPSWGMTDFTQRINYRRALEGELERTIGKMRGVAAAQVHLALHETSGFRRAAERPTEASVVLKLHSGAAAAPDVVRGIAHLVASSVDGLESERVTVLDDGGRLLSSPDEPSSVTGLTSRQLAIQQEVETHLERKAEGLVSQMVGAGNARIKVSADVNFDRVERTTQTVDADRQALLTEQRAEIVPGPEGGAGSTNTANSYENSRSTEVVSGAVGDVKRLTVAVLVNDRAVAGADSAGPPTFAARTPQELAQIALLVRSAVGADSVRGDVVTVVGMRFESPLAMDRGVDEAPTVWERVQTFQKPAFGGLALLVLAVVALLALRALKPVPTQAPALAAPVAAGALGAGAIARTPAMAPALGAAVTGAPALAIAAAPPPPPPDPSPIMLLRNEIASNVERDPDVAARLVRTWMRES